MTVSSIEPVNNYTGNSSNTKFDFDFLIENASELVVQHTNSDGLISILKEGIDYTINEIGNPNGSYILFPVSGSSYGILAEDEKISLMLSLVIKQEKEIRNSLFFNLDLLEWMFDYVIRILQIMHRQIERSIKIHEGSSITADELLDFLQRAQVEAQNYALLSKSSAELSENYSILAKKYSEDAEFGMKWIYFSSNDWVGGNSEYTLTLSDISVVNAVYKGSWSNKYKVINVDVEISGNNVILTSKEAFEGYILSSASVIGSYVHTQSTASNEWIIIHDLGCYPSITVTDEDYAVIECTKIYNSLNKITLQFANEVTGKVFLR